MYHSSQCLQRVPVTAHIVSMTKNMCKLFFLKIKSNQIKSSKKKKVENDDDDDDDDKNVLLKFYYYSFLKKYIYIYSHYIFDSLIIIL